MNRNKLSLTAFFTLGLIFTLSMNLNASLTNYAHSVRNEEKKNSPNDTYSTNQPEQTFSTNPSNTSFCGGCMRPFFNLLGSLAVKLWAINNLSVCYLSSPYASSETDFIYHESFEEERITKTPGKHGYILAGIGYVYSPQVQSQGLNLFVRGHFWKFFGPELDCRSLWDGNDYLGYYGLGFNLSLFQHVYFSADLYLQYAVMTGVLERRGAAYGAVFQSFPVRPLFIFAKVGAQSYPNISFLDIEARLGALFGHFGVSAGYGFQSSETTFLGNFQAGIMVCF